MHSIVRSIQIDGFLTSFMRFLPITILVYVFSFSFAQIEKPIENPVLFSLCDTVNDSEGTKVFQGLNGWLFHDGDLIENVDISLEVLEKLADLKKVFDYLDIDIVFANLPTRGMFHYENFDLEQEVFSNYDPLLAIKNYESSILILQELGFVTPNLVDELNTIDSGKNYGYIRDSHWNPNASALVAKILASAINKNLKYEEMLRDDFEVIYHGVGERESDLSSLAMNRCPEIRIPKEPQKWYTLEKNGPNLELLISDNPDDIVLLGSSFSTNSSFMTFLQNELELEVVSYAIGGASIWAPVFSYFLAKDREDDYPGILIWETPYKLLDQLILLDGYYNELIPTMLGDCETEYIVVDSLSQEVNHINKEDDIPISFQIDPRLNIRSGHYYSSLLFEDLSIVDFKITYHYEDSYEYTQPIYRGPRIPNNGKFFYDIMGESSASLKEIKIEVDSEVSSTVRLKICEKPPAF